MTFFKDKKYEAVRQLLLVWLIIYMVPWVERLMSLRRYEHLLPSRRDLVYIPVMTLCVAAPVVGHYYLLYRKYAMKGHYRKYFLRLPLYVLSVILLDTATNYVALHLAFPGNVAADMFSILQVAILRVVFADMTLAYVYAAIRQHYAAKHAQKALEAEQYANEIKLLRTKLPPSFIINVLRTLTTKANNENAPETAVFLREVNDLFIYSVGQASAETIPVRDELAFIGKYVQLQKRRIAGDSPVVIEAELANDDTGNIAPMLLLPFVENAFKYGISYELPSRISIKTRMQNGVLQLEVENTDHASKNRDSSTGTGLTNVRRRLELQYKDKYQLEQRKDGGIYSVSLKLNLN